jgi:sugar/nucleoside kinase (ribokinase family)
VGVFLTWEMNFDIIFIGHLCYDEVRHYDSSRSFHAGGAALYGAVAAARAGRKVAAHMMCAPADDAGLAALRDAGVKVVRIPSPETTRVEVIHASTNMEDRRIITRKFAGQFTPEMIPPLNGRFVHLAGCNDHEFTPAFVRAMKQRGYSLSADMQSFVRYNDPQTGEMRFDDDPSKQEVVACLDRVKLDITEARLLTGSTQPAEASAIVRSWGCPEVMITTSEGVHVRCGEETCFARFTNRSTVGRTGRGDTTFGSYLAWRVECALRESARFAAALVSLKMERPGPFVGTLEDVLERMRNTSLEILH